MPYSSDAQSNQLDASLSHVNPIFSGLLGAPVYSYPLFLHM